MASMLERVAASGVSEALKYLLVNVIKTYFVLSDEDHERYRRLLTRKEFRAVQEVELTWADRLLEKGREEGREAGVIEGKRKTLLRQLSAKFGAIPEGVRARTEAMTESGATPTARLPLVERLGPTPRGEIGLGWRSRAGP